MIYVLSGNSSLYAVIAVTYPSGSICTCGGKAANDTSGFALFNVKAGKYTVECRTSDGEKSKSTSVTIAASDEGKAKNVTLSYRRNLYTKGVENVAWTTEDSASSLLKVSKASTYLNFYTTANFTGTSGRAYTSAIDLSGYNKVHVIGTWDSAYEIKIEVRNSSNSVVATTSVSKTSGNFTASLDISSITKTNVSVNIVVGGYNPGGAVTLATVSEVYAE